MQKCHIVSTNCLVSHRQVSMSARFRTPVVHFLAYSQLLLVVLDGGFVETSGRICISYVAVSPTHSCSVLEITCYRQVGLM